MGSEMCIRDSLYRGLVGRRGSSSTEHPPACTPSAFPRFSTPVLPVLSIFADFLGVLGESLEVTAKQSNETPVFFVVNFFSYCVKTTSHRVEGWRLMYPCKLHYLKSQSEWAYNYQYNTAIKTIHRRYLQIGTDRPPPFRILVFRLLTLPNRRKAVE